MNCKRFLFKTSVVILCLFCANCQKKERTVTVAFYHWKSSESISNYEKKVLDSLKSETIYKRFFDVDWNDEAHFPEPISIVKKFNSQGLKIIPTVFITNKTFIKIADNQLDTFVLLFLQKLNQNTCLSGRQAEGVHDLEFEMSDVGKNLEFKTQDQKVFDEIQVDCDWTQSTRDKFFLFLKKLKTVSQKKISATIRLHQIKDRSKMGIPPVDKGMLMVYNMGDLENPQANNSILDTKVLKSYISNLKSYNLKLDIALPIFSWGVVVRDGAVVKLINNQTEDDFLPSCEGVAYEPLPIRKLENNRFEILENMYFKGYYLYKNDEIRLESIPLSLPTGQAGILTETADILTQNIDNQQLTIAFFHLDSVLLKRYNYENLHPIVQKFK